MADTLCMDKCVCVVHLFYTRIYMSSLMPRVFLLLHRCVTRVCRLSCG